MKLQFIGTGAADYDWSKYGEPGIAGSTSTLLNDTILLDCGPTVPAALKRFGVDPMQITDIVLTHSHSDHFNIESVKQVAKGHTVRFYGSPQACEQVKDICEVHPFEKYGDTAQVENCTVMAIPASHYLPDLHEPAYLYIITDNPGKADSKTLLYALDTAWMPSVAHAMLGKTHLDAIVWDATMSKTGDWRIFDHSDPAMFKAIRQALYNSGNIDDSVKVWFDHRARTLWPTDPAEQEAIAQQENVMLAHEGEIVTI